MNKTESYLVLAGVSLAVAAGCGLLWTGLPFHPGQQMPKTPFRVSASAARPALSVGRTPAAEPVQTDVTTPDAAAPVFQFPANGGTVPDQALLKLCAMVNIANAVNEAPDKNKWQEALPIAEKLLDYPCDCAQRNWLSHFVELGNDALHGSEQEYNTAAQVLTTLGRNNAQAVALSKGLR